MAKQLLSISQLSRKDVDSIFSLATSLIKQNAHLSNKITPLSDYIVINMFFEYSTRTRTAFELACKRLGAYVVNIQGEASSAKKGESIIDTAQTLSAMAPQILIVRHEQSGAVDIFAKHFDGIVINAGDGLHEHPTQALLDAFTIQQQLGSVKGKTIAICGDILHSRVARSNLRLLHMLGAKLRVVGPPPLIPADIEEAMHAKPYYAMEEGIKDVDVIMMLRLQKERMRANYIASEREFNHLYGLNHARLKLAKKNAMVLHPGPVMRGVEICSSLEREIPQLYALKQVENGIAVRQALLLFLTGEQSAVSSQQVSN